MKKNLTPYFPLSIFHSFKGKVVLKRFYFLNLIFILVLLIFYVFQVNYLAQDIASIKEYEKKLSYLLDNTEKLEIDWAKSSSLVNIESYLQNHDFRKINPAQVKYIRILESSVAKKR